MKFTDKVFHGDKKLLAEIFYYLAEKGLDIDWNWNKDKIDSKEYPYLIIYETQMGFHSHSGMNDAEVIEVTSENINKIINKKEAYYEIY